MFNVRCSAFAMESGLCHSQQSFMPRNNQRRSSKVRRPPVPSKADGPDQGASPLLPARRIWSTSDEKSPETGSFEIDKKPLGIFVATFAPLRRSACRLAECKRSAANLAAHAIAHGEDEITRDPGVIAFRPFFLRHNPRAALHDYFSATQPRHLRRHPEQEWMKTKWKINCARTSRDIGDSQPCASKHHVCWIDINFRLGWRNNLPMLFASLWRHKVA